jgi:hypothetical protein
MSAIVVNRIKLRVPVEEVVSAVDREVLPVLRALPGFERASLVQVGANEMVVVISWSSVETAGAGAAILGPGVFNRFIAPHAESQDRVVGPVLLDVRADQARTAVCRLGGISAPVSLPTNRIERRARHRARRPGRS